MYHEYATTDASVITSPNRSPVVGDPACENLRATSRRIQRCQNISLTANCINRGGAAERILPKFAEFRSATGRPRLV